MGKTTIFRSEVLFAAILCAATSAQAQQQGGMAGAGQEPPQARLIQGAPAVHVVRDGETLWTLAQQYYGDPLMWPEIYRLNTDVVEDPHWIYPGEELRLVPGEEPAPTVTVDQQSITVTPTGDSAAAPVTMAPTPENNGPTIFARNRGSQLATTALDLNLQATYRAVRAGEYYSAGFLTEDQPLTTGRILANATTAMRGLVRTRTSAQPFEEVVISPPDGTPLDSGALLLAFAYGPGVAGYGQMVEPTGLLRVTRSTPERTLARVERMFGRIVDGQYVMTLAPFAFDASGQPAPVENGLEGSVLRLKDERQAPGLQTVLFLDKGADDGVRMGDVFMLYVEHDDGEGGRIVQDQGRAIVVSTRGRSSTAVLIEVYRQDVGPGSNARLVRRLPS